MTASSPRSHDADVYRRYAATLYRQALLTRNDPALAEHVGCDVITDECALAAIAEHGDDESRYRRAESVLRRCRQLAPSARRGRSAPRALLGLLAIRATVIPLSELGSVRTMRSLAARGFRVEGGETHDGSCSQAAQRDHGAT